ncbi:acyl carrier protein [Gemelliphila asaccharolytica]|uniref:Acyl carrier protein n=1 Tax=Gemelliphila asaccharolytica TaxID=502393 RepID=A0ABR5TMI2_9BACL|nr:acyl carrier protein [Gemella asaccharolytica]KXB58547.1 putative acyl carrier protein [Gemella asaccharolytica]
MILEDLKKIITRHIDVLPENITMESDLNDDLDADSIEIAEVVMDIEEKYNFEFSDEDTTKIKKVRDLVEFIKSKMNN